MIVLRSGVLCTVHIDSDEINCYLVSKNMKRSEWAHKSDYLKRSCRYVKAADFLVLF